MLHAPNDFHAAHDNAPAGAANQINKKKEIKNHHVRFPVRYLKIYSLEILHV